MLELFQVSWPELIQKMPEIAEAGYTSLYLPPPQKAGSVFSVGYDVFDPFDLGDKNQRGTVATKYGTRDQLVQMVETAHRFGIRVYFDNIMNHRGFDVPGYNATTPTNLYPGLRPQDFHLQKISGGFFRNWPNVEDYNNQFDVQYEPLSGLIDLANEPGNVNGNFGNTLGSTTPKVSYVRQPNNPEYYMDPTGVSLGGGWKPFNGTNGVPVAEDVNAYLIRSAMWTLAVTKCDGFRLDAVKHTPSGFFGDTSGSFAGYTGGIQAMYDWVHGYGTNVTGNGYFEPDDSRNSCFDTEAPRNDAELFGEHLGSPPSFGEYIARGMRLLNTPLRSQLDSALQGSSSLSGFDQPSYTPYGGAFSPLQGVQFAQDQDHSFCCVAHRDFHNAYYFLREGLPMIYSDGYNAAGPVNDAGTFPIVPLANYLGQFGDNQMPEIVQLHNQLARGGTRPRWSDQNIVAFERYDYRDVNAATAFSNPDATVALIVMNDNYGFPGDISFDDGVAQAADGYYTCPPNGNPSRGVGLVVGFPPGSVLTQMATTSPGANRTCARLLVHQATTNQAEAQATANDPTLANRKIYVGGQSLAPGGGAVELLVPSGGWVVYAYQWPEPSRASLKPAITLRQGGADAPTIPVLRHDGYSGDTNFNPIYPFKGRGSIDSNGNIVGGTHVSNLTYQIDVPIVTNGAFDVVVRSDASAGSALVKLDGGMDLNSQMGLGATGGLDRRDNKPGYVSDVFLGYEQSTNEFRYGPEKFAARLIARNNVTSAGAESYSYTVGGASSVTNGNGNGANIATSTASWVYHDPAATNTVATGGTATQRVPFIPAANQSVDIWVKVGYQFQIKRCYIYFTTDGSSPEGSFGAGQGTTRVIQAAFAGDDAADGTIDWWKGTIPGSNHLSGTQVRYKIALFNDAIGPMSDSDDGKIYGLTQSSVTNFNPATAVVWTHNDLNTNNTQTGLSEGFHVIRGRTFLPRSGKSGSYNTFTRTFYYDAQPPAGAVAFPPNDGFVVNSNTYTVVVRTDGSVTGVEYNINDSDPGNDDSITGQNFGNGATNGVAHFVAATPVTPDSSLNASYPALPLEYRFNYAAVPTNGTATITVRLKELSSSVFSNRITTLTRTVTTAAPGQTLRIVNPASDGMILVAASNTAYTLQACFTSTLSTNNISPFSIYINGVFQPRTNNLGAPLYFISASGCGAGMRSLSYQWTNALPGTNVIQINYSNQVLLADTRVAAVVRPGDSDGDGMSDYEELIAGTDPFDPSSVLRITSLENGQQLIVWNSVSNVNYQVLATTNLNVPMSPISPTIPGGGASAFYYDNQPATSQKYYRVQVVP